MAKARVSKDLPILSWVGIAALGFDGYVAVMSMHAARKQGSL